MIIADMDALTSYLAQAQSNRESCIACELTPALSARMNDTALVEVLVTGLSMAQGVQHRIVRSRGRGAVLMAKVRYREGVRMLAGDALTAREADALNIARQIAAQALPLEEEARFRYVYDWVCRKVSYVHTAPGKTGYERLVGASGALLERQANCQGFADVLYLLCGICHIDCEYRCGRGQRRLHLWNAVRLEGEWREVDASRGARC